MSGVPTTSPDISGGIVATSALSLHCYLICEVGLAGER